MVHSWEGQPCVTMRRFHDPRMKGSWVNDCLEEIVCRLKGSISREEQLKVLAAVREIGTNETWLGSYSTEDVLAVNVFPSIHRYLGASVEQEFELWRMRTFFFSSVERQTRERCNGQWDNLVSLYVSASGELTSLVATWRNWNSHIGSPWACRQLAAQLAKCSKWANDGEIRADCMDFINFL